MPQYRQEGAEHFEKAIELDSWNAGAHYHYAELEEMRLPWRARPHYEKILEIDPEHRGLRERLEALDTTKSEKGCANDHLDGDRDDDDDCEEHDHRDPDHDHDRH